jgi:hypothetical protein
MSLKMFFQPIFPYSPYIWYPLYTYIMIIIIIIKIWAPSVSLIVQVLYMQIVFS